MKSICSEITHKMKSLGVIVKEPMYRRASFDDYHHCFDYFSRKNINSQNLIQSSSFGLSLGTAGSAFSGNVELRNLAKDEMDDELEELSDFLPENLE